MRVEKIFRHAEAVEKGFEFRFLASFAVHGTACEQKTKNAKKAVNSMFTAFLYKSNLE